LKIDSKASTLTHTEYDCTSCPISKFRGKPCDEKMVDEWRSPYTRWCYTGENEDMIDLLIQTRAWVETLDDEMTGQH
jgi:hypothetical protein